MRKIGTIILLGIFTISCSVTRYNSKESYNTEGGLSSEYILERAEKQNLTKTGFFIQKAEIEIFSNNGKEKLIGNIKFEYPEKYLISLRSRSGIEGARIYISKDSILVNDRINKKLYFGNSYYVKKKYGIDQNFLPLLLGDIIIQLNAQSEKEKCSGETYRKSCVVRGVSLNYNIDCKKGKTVLVNNINSTGSEDFSVKYDKFFNSGNGLVPGIIEFEETAYSVNIRIKIVKIESPWPGKIKFVPGKDYELIELV